MDSPVVPDAIARGPHQWVLRSGNVVLLVLTVLLILCVLLSWGTGGTMLRLLFLSGPAQTHRLQDKALVDVTPWQTAHALAELAVTPEGIEYSREAERLADHEVDQAFASALREATLQVQHRTLTGRALALSQRVDELQQLLNQDKAQLDGMIQASSAPAAAGKGKLKPQVDDKDVEIAKAQLQLDTDQLQDVQQDLATISGDNRARIQSEHASREAAMRKQESEPRLEARSTVRLGTLVGRISAWTWQITGYRRLQQAIQQAQRDIQAITAQRDALKARVDANRAAMSGVDRAEKLARIRDESAGRQLLSIYDNRIQTQQALITVYGKWSDLVVRQRGIVQRLILRSAAFILFILICMILGMRLVRRVMSLSSLDRRQSHTVRIILNLLVQLVGVVAILFIIFGVPQNTATMLGLATAALTIALQDFIISFLGWFRLVGKRGIRVGDLVEVNGVAGEAVDIGVLTTTLLEVGNRGYRTGRRIAFLNSFAIRGQYFNFSTAGQWMWDELTISLPSSLDTQTTMTRLIEVVQEETGQSARMAEQEWKHTAQRDELDKFRTDPAVNLRPSGSGVDIEIRYVTRAWDRVEMRNRLFGRIHEHLHHLLEEPNVRTDRVTA